MIRPKNTALLLELENEQTANVISKNIDKIKRNSENKNIRFNCLDYIYKTKKFL